MEIELTNLFSSNPRLPISFDMEYDVTVNSNEYFVFVEAKDMFTYCKQICIDLRDALDSGDGIRSIVLYDAYKLIGLNLAYINVMCAVNKESVEKGQIDDITSNILYALKEKINTILSRYLSSYGKQNYYALHDRYGLSVDNL